MTEFSRQFGNTSRVRISIPSFHANSDGKGHIVYKIVIAKPGGDKEVLKRYSEFYKLHKSLKEGRKLPKGECVEFPPKKLNPSATTNEERRKKLEKYLQFLSEQDPISSEVLTFLGISQPRSAFKQEIKEVASASSCEDLVDFPGQSSSHQPILGFLKDPFIDEHRGNSLSDVLLEGILDGLYEDFENPH